MITIAQLDERGVLVGYLQKDEAAPGDIVVPDNCDLALGRYTWNGSTFVPRGRMAGRDTQTLPAIAMGLIALRDGKPMPQATLDWLAQFEGGD